MAKFAQNLIQVVNELQDKLKNTIAFDLPQIVVIGGQSSGKSSVLESIVGRDFLPRGSGIVTRRPLVLQLISNKDITEDFGEFVHSPGNQFRDFNEIRDEIIAETDREVLDCGISSKPINLKIYSPDVLDLTLVDLPGMTRVAVGNQPKDIEARIEEMILEYISGENCLILAVTAANQDLATSDALKLANKVDPEGNRTIGVLTKLDLMDKGTDASDIINGNHPIRLKRGFHGVVNRSQKDIENNKDIKKALEDEHEFFEEHESYGLSIERMGIKHLQQYLQTELSKHIAKRLPPLKAKTELNLSKVNEKLKRIEFPESIMEKERLLAQTIESFCNNFNIAMGGSVWKVDVNNPSCGAVINVLMNDSFPKEIDLLFYDEKSLNRKIATAIQNSFGTRSGVFIPDAAFTSCVGPLIDLFIKPSIACIDWVTDEITNTIHKCLKDINCFSNLNKIFAKFTMDFILESNNKCKEIVDHLIEMEKCYPNTHHEDFIEMIGDGKTIAVDPDIQMDGKVVLPQTIQQNAQNLMSDWISYQKNDLYFVLKDTTLCWFKDEKQNGKKGSLELKGCQIASNSDVKLALVLSKSYRITNQFILTFNTQFPRDKWYNWIAKAGVTVATNQTIKSIVWQSKYGDSIDGSQLSANDMFQDVAFPDMHSQVDEVKRYLHTYFVILKKTFKDRLPKLCQLELINATSKFIRTELQVRFRDQLTIDEIIGEDPDKELRIKLEISKKEYTDAIAIMNKYSKMRL